MSTCLSVLFGASDYVTRRTRSHALIKVISCGFILGASSLSGCVVKQSTPTCDDAQSTLISEDRADEICRSRELVSASREECEATLSCEEVIIDSCGEQLTVYCQAPPACPDLNVQPVDVCADEGLVAATEAECEGNTLCQSFTQALGCDVDYTSWCRPAACPDSPQAPPELICEGRGLVSTTREACDELPDCDSVVIREGCPDESEVFCRPAMICEEDGRVDPETICQNEGLTLADPAQCDTEATCITISTLGGCDMTYNTLCQVPLSTCDAWPTCGEGLIESEDTCRRGELSCEFAVECGYVTSCRPEAVCLALPSCAADEVESWFGCESDEEDCRAVEMCGQTIFCRPQNPCRGLPVCEEGTTESDDPCLATESTSVCRAHTMCGTTITCR